MKKRDRDIIKALEHFRALERNQIATMFYKQTKNATTNANYALKRLRDRGYILANTNCSPYVYFPNPSRIKQDGQKVDHFLKIADFYLDVLQNGWRVKEFIIEPHYNDADVRPDIYMLANGSAWWIEVQNSQYSQNIMNAKMKRYESFLESGSYKQIYQEGENPVFPYVWIISDTPYKIKSTFRVFQSKDVRSFMDKIQAARAPQKQAKQQKPQSKNAAIVWNMK